MPLLRAGVFRQLLAPAASARPTLTALFASLLPARRTSASVPAAATPNPPAPTVTQDDGDRNAVIARAAIQLAHMAPELARLSGEIATGAATQAEQAALLARLAEGMTAELVELAQRLRASTRDAGAIVGMIERIASQTKILSINAAIEAARSGNSGSAFGIIAREIQALAVRTTDGTGQVVATIGAIREQARHAEAVVGNSAAAAGTLPGEDHAREDGTPSSAALDQLNARIRSIVAISATHSDNAARLSQASSSTRQRCEDMLMAIGSTRFAVHQRAAEALSRMAALGELRSGSRPHQEACLRQALNEYAFFDLLYLTDTDGIQPFPNIARSGFNAIYGSSGAGRNWASRPWFRAVAESVARQRAGSGQVSQAHPVVTSDLYRSLATDDFCFTVSTALFDVQGQWLGVLAADADLERLL